MDKSDLSAKIAMLAGAIGLALSLGVSLVFSFDSVWPGYVLQAVAVYLWAGVCALVSSLLSRARAWALIVGFTPLLLWGLRVALGAGDLTPLLPIFVYGAAVWLAFRKRVSGQPEI